MGVFGDISVAHDVDVSHGRVSEVQLPPKLKVVCVATGRDGTQSLNHMIEYLYAKSGARRSMHEYCCREFNQAFCEFVETGDAGAAGALDRMIADCPFECIVGNGYAAILPLFAKHYGRGLKVVHLCRTDRDACIASLVKNSEMFPTAHRYYSQSPEATIKRMTAFHFGEMSHAAWDRLTLLEKFSWYYDKTHALVRQHLTLFDASMLVQTEHLNDAATRLSVADFVADAPTIVPPKTHLNASSIEIGSFAKEHRAKMHWLMGRLNIEEAATDDVYALEYFLNKFIAWSGYQITAAPELEGTLSPPDDEIAANLKRAAKILNSGLRDIDELSKIVGDRQNPS